MRLIPFLAGGAFLVVAGGAFLAAGSAASQTAVGELRCNVQGGFGVIIAANRAVTCTYRRPGRPVEFYTGSTGNIGIDVGPTNAASVTYKVLSADPAAPAALQGDFAGPGFGAAGGGGVAGRVLVGGTGGVTLLPVPTTATTAYTGLNISAGINQLHLQFAAVEEVPDYGRRRRARPARIDLQ